MDDLYRSYVSFLRSLSQGLESLTDLAEKKYAAAQRDDLLALNELLNQEQAQSLNFRGLELTRDKLLPKLGLTGVPLSKIPERCPPDAREEVRQAVEALQSRYRAYQTASGRARTLIEQNLHEIETAIVQMGGPPAAERTGAGYRKEAGTEPPPSMKTDFRA